MIQNLTVDDNYPWEIAFNEPEKGDSIDMLETPQIIDVAVNFKPILNILPQIGFDNNGTGVGTQTPILIASQGKSAKEFLGITDGVNTNN